MLFHSASRLWWDPLRCARDFFTYSVLVCLLTRSVVTSARANRSTRNPYARSNRPSLLLHRCIRAAQKFCSHHAPAAAAHCQWQPAPAPAPPHAHRSAAASRAAPPTVPQSLFCLRHFALNLHSPHPVASFLPCSKDSDCHRAVCASQRLIG